MKHINLVRAMPVGCTLAAATYIILSRVSHGTIGDIVAGISGGVVACVFYIQIRLGYMPWFEKKDGIAHRVVLWLEDVFPFLRGPRK
jgi:hypothetical protein